MAISFDGEILRLAMKSFQSMIDIEVGSG